MEKLSQKVQTVSKIKLNSKIWQLMRRNKKYLRTIFLIKLRLLKANERRSRQTKAIDVAYQTKIKALFVSG